MYKRKIQSILIALLMAVETIAVPMSAYGAQSVSENAAVEVETVETDGAVEEIAEPVADVVPAEKATIKYSGVDGDLSWSIDTNGHLMVTGEGDYEDRDKVRYPYESGWLVYYDEILSATVNVSGISSTKDMFSYCYNMTSIDLTNLNTINVTDMSNMFSGCKSLKMLDLSNFVTSRTTNMKDMFNSCCALTELDLTNFSTINTYNMSGMFSGCFKLNNLDLSSFNTRYVTNMLNMFWGCGQLTSLNLENFDTRNVTNISQMFYGCERLTELDLSNFNTSQVKEMVGVFSECISLKTLNLNGFDTSNVEIMHSMFSGCTNLEYINIEKFDTSKVKRMGYMFEGCSNLKCLDLSNFNTAQVYDMVKMFYGCEELTHLNLSGFVTDNVKESTDILEGCSNLLVIKIPKYFMIEIDLPITSEDELWENSFGEICTKIEKGITSSVVYTRYTIQDISETTAFLEHALAYTGKELTPLPTVTYQGSELKKDIDYTLSYTNNINPGTATITITGKGKYTGTKKVTFKIEVELAKATFDTLDYTYQKGNLAKLNSKNHFSLYLDFTPVEYALKYEIELTNNKGKKVKSVIVDCANKDYVDKTIKNLTGAVYGVRIRAIRDDVYGDWSTKAFVLKQPRAQARSYNGNVQIKWEKINGATGYEIYMCDKRNGKYKKVATAGKNAILKTVKKYNKKKLGAKTYYYYVVAKKKVGGKTYKSSKNFVYKVVNK